MATCTGDMDLSEDDINVVYDILYAARAKWYEIGLQLKVKSNDLDAIRLESTNHLLDMLKRWLRFPNTTWLDVVEALRRPSVNELRLAERISVEHCYESPAVTPKATETEEIPEQRELLDSLKAKAKVSSIPKHDTVRPVVSEGGDVVERDIAITKRAKAISGASNGKREAQPPRFIWLLRLASIAMIVLSPVLVCAGIALIAFSFREFAGDLQCDGVGIVHSLSVFNLFLGLLCLCVPGLLVTLILYFRFEDRSTHWKQKFRITRCVVWTNTGIFLLVFILIVFELLFSLLYIVPEVIGHFNDWDELQSGSNETLCDAEIYISSATAVIVSYALVFLLLSVLGVYLANLYFKWVTDEDNPGALRRLIQACLHKYQPINSVV